jgi:predicted RNA-binding protein with PIN domain
MVLKSGSSKLIFQIMHWILDGYNIILSDEKLARIAGNSLEAGRDELVREISSTAKLGNDHIFLVFDGKSSGSSEKVTRNLEIKFTKNHETADDLIKSMVGTYNSRVSVRVVSNDYSIIGYAKECGATTVRTGDFLELLRTQRIQEKEKEAFPEKPLAPVKSDPELLRLFKEKKRDV